MVPTDPQLLPGGCLVVMGGKMNVFVSLEKRCFRTPGTKRGVWGDPPPILGTKLALWYDQIQSSKNQYLLALGMLGVSPTALLALGMLGVFPTALLALGYAGRFSHCPFRVPRTACL